MRTIRMILVVVPVGLVLGVGLALGALIDCLTFLEAELQRLFEWLWEPVRGKQPE